jgi:hypothetical protein
LLEFSNDTVTEITESYTSPSFLPTDSSVEILYSPYRDWDPATKKYVDNRTYIPSDGLIVGDEKYANR